MTRCRRVETATTWAARAWYVLENEPPAASSPLWGMPNVIIIAAIGVTVDQRKRTAHRAVHRNLRRWLGRLAAEAQTSTTGPTGVLRERQERTMTGGKDPGLGCRHGGLLRSRCAHIPAGLRRSQRVVALAEGTSQRAPPGRRPFLRVSRVTKDNREMP